MRGNILYHNNIDRGHRTCCNSGRLLKLSTIALPTCVAIHGVATTPELQQTATVATHCMATTNNVAIDYIATNILHCD